MPKTCVLALDGWTWRAVDPLLADGVLPRLSELIARGARGTLLSTFPPVTACAWTGCFTGCGPGRSGIFDFQTYDRREHRFVVNNAAQIRSATLWEMLDAAGRSFVSVNVPMSYPPRPLSGVTVSGMMAPVVDRSAVHPPEIFDEYVSKLPGYAAIDTRFDGDVSGFVDRQIRLEELRTELVLRLMADKEPELVAVQFHAADAAQHFLWHAVDPDGEADGRTRSEMRRLFVALDGCVGRIVDVLDDQTTIMAVSDHGFGPQDGTLYLNSWLVGRGLLRLRGGGVRLRRTLNVVLGARWASRLDRVRRRLVRNRSFGGQLLSARSKDWSAQLDLENSAAIAVGSYYAGIYLAGSPQDRRELAEQLKAELLGGAITDERGNAVAGAFLPEEVYDGPYLDNGPDLTIQPRDGLSIAHAATKSRAVYHAGEPYGPTYTGCHRPEGIVIAAGPGIKTGDLTRANLVDICPTILAALHLPVPDGLDGIVRSEWFRDGLEYERGSALKRNRQDETYAPEDRARVEQRLADLGYL